ncbi:hypothetical protein [Paenibacillus ehimensis]|uniref:hypothetical protein n=1 Tax=Paenibacillus ehimensis TaxID=79264 RepID=UPI00046F3525|nr:hypothetical protein [Paenibacillus ehimensis]
MDGYKHYVRTDAAGVVVHGFSSAFESPEPTDICIDENAGRHFALELRNERGQLRYKMQKGKLIERTEAELDAEWNTRPPEPPSALELLGRQVVALELRQLEGRE